MTPQLTELLNELESASKIADYEIGSRFHALANANPDVAKDIDWKAEAIGFNFMESGPNEDGKYEGDFYVPSITWVNEDGTTHGTPDVSLITPEIISYWQHRNGETANPLLKARYSGLVWEFAQRVTGQRPSHEIARNHVAALIAIAEKDLAKFEVDAIRKLRRGLDIACSLNADDLVQEAKAAILKYENRIAVDEMLGMWGFSFDILIGNKRVKLTTEEESKIVGDMEARFERLCTNKSGNLSDPFRCEAGASRLAEYYRRAGRTEDMRRVIRKLGDAFNTAMDLVSPLQAMTWAEHMHDVYKTYQLNEEAEQLARKLRELGPKIKGEMKTFSHEVQIPREELEKLVEKFTAGSLEQTLGHIAASFIPKRKDVEDMVKALAKMAPLQARIPKHVTDAQGRLLSKIGSIDDDLDGNIVHQMSQNIGLHVPVLGTILDETNKRFQVTAESLTGYLLRSPAFVEGHRTFLEKGIAAYYSGDHLLSAHLLIPQVENAARAVLELTGGVALKQRRDGGFDLKTLGDILYEDSFKKVFGEDASLYFRVLLTDQRGWNLRNNVMHGILPVDAYTKVMSDRILHVLLCFALIQPIPKPI